MNIAKRRGLEFFFSKEFEHALADFRVDIVHTKEMIDRVSETCTGISKETGFANDLASERCRDLYLNLERVPFIAELLDESSTTVPEKVALYLEGKENKWLDEHLETLIFLYESLLDNLNILADPTQDLSLNRLEEVTHQAVQLKELIQDIAGMIDDISKPL